MRPFQFQIPTCCFGGPLHGELLNAVSTPVLVSLPQRAELATTLDETTLADKPKTGRYDSERFAFTSSEGQYHAWDALVWQGGWYQDQPIPEYITNAMTICAWLPKLWSLWR